MTEARARLADVVDEARAAHEPVFLTRGGRRVAAVVDADDLQRLLEAAEDLADIRAAQDARDEMERTGEGPVPWEQVKADLGQQLVGGKAEWRIRTGDYRVVSEIDDAVLRVLVVAIGHRREVYRR